MRTKPTILLILSASLSLASIISVYYTHQLPTEEEITKPLCFYSHNGQYDYTAKLKPNTLYNQPTLKPGQGTLFTKIIDHINITFTYKFICSYQTSTSIEYHTNMELESPEKWTKTFSATEILKTFQIANTVNSTQQKASTNLFLNPTQIDELVRTIDGQIGISTSKYNIAVKPEIRIVAEIAVADADVHTLYESFAPSLTIEFGKGTPDHISIENLEQIHQGKIEETRQTFLPWVINQRIASYIAAIFTLPALGITAWKYIRTKPPSGPKPIEKIIAPHKEIIAETTQKPPEKTQTINMKTLEDLAKISEALIRPILYTKEETTHIFYILDNTTIYQYKTKTPTKT